MSLDVSLHLDDATPYRAILVREAGSIRELTRAEWDKRNPDREPVTIERTSVYSGNITHNLQRMADAAGLYECLWCPEELGYTVAGQLVAPLRIGLMALEHDPAKFEAFNPSNGWGSYDGLKQFVAEYLAACERYPDAAVRVSK
jgi:hypothetical protein